MKRALVIGINYTGSDAALNGCINDAHDVVKMLTEEFAYPRDNIVLVADDEILTPTKYNILRQMLNVVDACKDGDELWIHYSGHGSYIPDYSGDEIDGKDEVLVPIDYNRRGVVTSNKMFDIL
jgi:uncharacterized caspase-like protein